MKGSQISPIDLTVGHILLELHTVIGCVQAPVMTNVLTYCMN